MSAPEVQLLVVLRSHKLALLEGRAQLSASLGLRVPEGWPQFPEALDPSFEGSKEWPGFFFVSPAHESVVGNGGFAGPPVDGQVEIGYEIAPEFRNQGLATSAARALIDRAFASDFVQAVVAHTLADRNASNAVLEKLGMTLVAEIPNEEVGKVWQWRIERPKGGNGAAAA